MVRPGIAIRQSSEISPRKLPFVIAAFAMSFNLDASPRVNVVDPARALSTQFFKDSSEFLFRIAWGSMDILFLLSVDKDFWGVYEERHKRHL